MTANKIKPELAGGFRDYLPEDMIPRNKMLEKIKAVFERFGFVPMDTPGLERSEVLGNEGSDFLIYKAGLEGVAGLPAGRQDLSLRYDLTVPLARFYAANVDKLPKPFRRYQFGRVWRGEKQQTGKGRWREFTQLDIDTIGSSSISADAEIVAVMYQTLTELGLNGNFEIRLNNRKILDGLSQATLRLIDKIDKIGREEVERQLLEIANPEELTSVKELLGGARTNNDLETLISNAKALGVPPAALRVDNTVIRGLDYYTGNIFEARLLNLPEIGSVFSGGRYDGLVDRFAPFSVPAVGASVGVDRLFMALDELGLLERQKITAGVLVLNFDETCSEYVQKLSALLRTSGVATELYLGQEKTLGGQITYAAKQEFKLAVIVGPEEMSRNTVQLRDMITRTQQEIAHEDLPQEVRKII